MRRRRERNLGIQRHILVIPPDDLYRETVWKPEWRDRLLYEVVVANYSDQCDRSDAASNQPNVATLEVVEYLKNCRNALIAVQFEMGVLNVDKILWAERIETAIEFWASIEVKPDSRRIVLQSRYGVIHSFTWFIWMKLHVE